jgi:hypothetical protein
LVAVCPFFDQLFEHTLTRSWAIFSL